MMKGTYKIGIILDNCAVHSTKATIKAFKDIGVNVYFILPYYPDLAPIEKIFLKARESCSYKMRC